MKIGLVLTAMFAAMATVTSAYATEKPFDIDALAGVYKKQFENGAVDGTKYRSENILELVKVSPTEAYFKTHLDFYNGHQCALWGVASVSKDGLLYKGEKDGDGNGCQLGINVEGDTIVFTDKNGACQNMSCGARGSYDGESFPLSKRRAIKYMPRLLASSDYKDALAEYKKSQK